MVQSERDEAPPIGDYALIGDCHSAALVSREGSIDWCCFRRFDKESVFGRLIDWEGGGFFCIAPLEPYRASRRYVPGTNVLETRFETDEGVVVLTDAFGMTDGTPEDPPMQLVRRLACESGSVRIRIEAQPRFDYGLTLPRIREEQDGLFLVFGGDQALVFDSGVPLACEDSVALWAEVDLAADDSFCIAVTSTPVHDSVLHRHGNDFLVERLEATCRYWQSWSDKCVYDGPNRDLVVRSALTLKAMTNVPTGAVVAAITTSLPETPGGVRNWDYRFTWLRDAAWHIDALFRLGYEEESDAFLRWLEHATAGRASDLQIAYGLAGERLLPETELSSLTGYRGAAPVRIGNGATQQFQLDVYGHVIEAMWCYHANGGKLRDDVWSFLCELLEVIDERWNEPDHGIWEVRGYPQHFTSSKIMAWVGVDRMLRLAEDFDASFDTERFRALADEIRAEIETRGVDPRTNALAGVLGDRTLDAATLLASLSGFWAPDDERVLATLEALDAELVENDLVFRYRIDDGIPGLEGAFVITSFWRVEAIARSGDLQRAREIFERLVDLANDVGLFAEQIDPRAKHHLGNFPQALSHIGLIRAATALADLEGTASH